MPGARSAYAERLTGGTTSTSTSTATQAARYGLTVGDVQDVIEAAIGGIPVAQTVEGRERYGIRVRYARELRDDPEALQRVLVPTPAGAQVPLGAGRDAARSAPGPPMVQSEDGQLFGLVSIDVAGRSLGEFVRDAQRAVREHVTLPRRRTALDVGRPVRAPASAPSAAGVGRSR